MLSAQTKRISMLVEWFVLAVVSCGSLAFFYSHCSFPVGSLVIRVVAGPLSGVHRSRRLFF